MENGVIEDKRRNGLQRCQEFLGGAWSLATIDEFHMEYIPYVFSYAFLSAFLAGWQKGSKCSGLERHFKDSDHYRNLTLNTLSDKRYVEFTHISLFILPSVSYNNGE